MFANLDAQDVAAIAMLVYYLAQRFINGLIEILGRHVDRDRETSLLQHFRAEKTIHMRRHLAIDQKLLVQEGQFTSVLECTVFSVQLIDGNDGYVMVDIFRLEQILVMLNGWLILEAVDVFDEQSDFRISAEERIQQRSAR